jgi:outer membrane receptor protein involved in Fe transport
MLLRSTSALVVDLNNIPSALIDSIEVITGGASAVYGSDAIAGVVNLRLKNRFEGLEVNGQYNITDRGDGEEYTIDALFGANFADGRGNVTFGAGYLERGNAYFTKRPFYREAFEVGAPPWGSDMLPQGTFLPAANNLPSQAAVNAVFARYGVAPGAIPTSGVLGINDDDTLFSQFGGLNYRGGYTDQIILSPFNNAVAFNVGTLQVLTAPTERINAFGRGEYEVSDDITAYAQGIFTDYRSTPNFAAGMQTQGTAAVVPIDNIFVPADLQELLASRPDPTAPFNMRKLWTATGTSVTKYDNNVYQVLAGLRGRFGQDWSWDLYGSHGKTKIVSGQLSGGASFSRIQSLLTSRADAQGRNVPAFIPSANGSNSLVPNPAYANAVNDGGRSFTASDGTQPCPEGLDIFGTTQLSVSCLRFLQIQTNNVTELEQDIVEGVVTGSIFELPAGPPQFLCLHARCRGQRSGRQLRQPARAGRGEREGGVWRGDRTYPGRPALRPVAQSRTRLSLFRLQRDRRRQHLQDQRGLGRLRRSAAARWLSAGDPRAQCDRTVQPAGRGRLPAGAGGSLQFRQRAAAGT